MENREKKQEEKKNVIIKRIIIILAALLILSGAGLIARTVYLNQSRSSDSYVSVPDNVLNGVEAEKDEAVTDNSEEEASGTEATSSISSDSTSSGASNTDNNAASETKAAYLELCKTTVTANEKFRVENMLPGDSVTKYFCVKTYHRKAIPVYFKADITEQTKNLADVLMIRVTIPETGEVLYDTTFKNADGNEKAVKLPQSQNGETTTYYEIKVYLDTGVGNQYQAASLNADFSWYIKDADQEELTPEPGKGDTGAKTGDAFNITLWVIFAISALALIILIIRSRMQKDKPDATHRKLRTSMAIAVLLALMLGITTYALFSSIIYVQDNQFATGTVKLNLNDGQPVIREDEYLFEPGMKVEKQFFIENEGSADSYYKLYLQDVKGELADVIVVTVSDGSEILYEGKLAEFAKGSEAVKDGTLAAGERRELEILFHFPEDTGNEAQDKRLQFTMGAVATQMKNNPEHIFE